jgi:zinc transporter ZupT
MAKVSESVLPLAETLMCTGFFLTCLVDVLVSRALSGKMRLCSSAETEADPTDDSAVRTVFVLSALSLHSVVEGMALGLETQTSGVWMNFGALATHKTVIALSLGAELVSAAVR